MPLPDIGERARGWPAGVRSDVIVSRADRGGMMTSAITRRSLLASYATSAIPLMTSGAFCDSYPTRAITLIVPYAAGGGTDIAARLIAPALSEIVKQRVIVVNR